MFTVLLLIPLAYLLGSIPTSIWMGRFIKGIDIREHGSGNAGTTNAIRVLGWGPGIIVLAIDVLKGFTAVYLANFQNVWQEGTEGWMVLKVLFGILAVVGHIFPLFAGFRGGKGVATLAGVGLAIHPLATLAAMGIYLLILLIFRISSLGSLSAAITYPLWIIFIFDTSYYSLAIFSVMVTIVIVITHLSNIKRLIKNEEKYLDRKKSSEP